MGKQVEMMTPEQSRAFLDRIGRYEALLKRCDEHDIKYQGRFCPLCRSAEAMAVLESRA